MGLVVGERSVRISSDLPLQVTVDGADLAPAPAGAWTFLWVDGVFQVDSTGAVSSLGQARRVLSPDDRL